MIEQIRKQMEQNNFSQVSLNAEKIFLYYTILNKKAYIILLMDCFTGEEYEEEQYRNILRQIKSNFEGKDFIEVQLLSVIFTNSPEKIKRLCMDLDNHWIVDQNRERLIIYENQFSDFLNMRKIIEDVLNLSYAQNSKEILYNKNLLSYVTTCTAAIILLNIIIFIIVEWVGSKDYMNNILRAGAMYWPKAIYEKEYYRLFTHMFLHFGIGHIANNMVILGFLGSKLECIIGKLKYIIIYFGSGVIAGIASMVYNIIQNREVFSAGASGAIFGVAGAMLYAVILNRGRIKDISTRQLIFFAVLSLYGGLTSPETDNMAHIGGFLGGLLIAIFLYRKPRKEEVERE